MVRSTQHGLISFSSRDQIIGRSLYLTGSFAHEDLAGVVAYLSKCGLISGKGIILDIGANIGTTSIPLLLNESFQNCLAFEPDPGNITRLKRNRMLNKLDARLEIFPAGLSDKSGELELWRSKRNYGDHRLWAEASGDGTQIREAIKVPLRTLDEVLSQRVGMEKLIELAWIDTQGFEAYVLKGARTLLSARCPLVLEFWPYGLRQAGSSAEEIFALTKNHYAHFIDLSKRPWQKQAISAAGALAQNYSGQDSYTDILLLP